MVTVSSAFISSRRERISFSVLSAAGCAFKAAARVDVLRAGLVALGKTELNNTNVARDHSFHCIANAESFGRRPLFYACGVNGFNIQPPIPRFPKLESFLPAILTRTSENVRQPVI